MRIKQPVVAILLAAPFLAPAAAQAWTKSYVVERYEPALYYAGNDANGADSAGPDCANGVDDFDQRAAMTTASRSKERVNHLMSAEVTTQDYNIALGFRGPNKELVYNSPTIMPDPGIKLSTSKISEGLNLDDNPETGFVGVDGEKGIDNNFYKVTGCSYRFRAKPWTASPFESRNGYMQDGAYTIVMVMSGKQDPKNDSDVTVGIYMSPDRMVKDSLGTIAKDYTFRVDTNPKFQSLFKAKIKDGQLESTDRSTVRVYDMDGYQFPLIELKKTKARFKVMPDGRMEGVIAGYRDWVSQYVQNFPAWNSPFFAGAFEKLGHTDAISYYYALRREADGIPDAQGRNTAISHAYRFKLVPAFVTNPNGDAIVQVAQAFDTAK